MDIIKSNGSKEEFSQEKLKDSICAAFESVGEKCDEVLLDVVSNNFYLYENMSTKEIRRQVEEWLMSVNKKAAKSYIENNDAWKDLKNKQDFISSYIEASNAASGSKYDANANVTSKNVVTLGQELYKENNIKQNRYILTNKIKSLYTKKLANQYLQDLESHVLYKHDESGTPGYPYTYSSKEVINVQYNGKNLLLPFDLLYDIVDEDETLVDDKNIVYQKTPQNLFVKDLNNSYTKITKVTKKQRHRDLVRVKTAFGEDLVVTDNHPMITNIDDIENTTQAIDILDKQQFKTNNKIEFKGKEIIDFKNILPTWVDVQDRYVLYSTQPIKRHIKVNRELGYVIGFFVGDGNYNNTDKTLHFTQSDKGVLQKINEIIYDIFGVVGKISLQKQEDRNDKYVLDVRNKYLYELFRGYFKIQDKSYNKTLPYNILEFTEDFAIGCLEGILDSDGTIGQSGTQITIRLASRACILQITQLFKHFGYSVGNVANFQPFSNNNSYKSNYTIWGVNATLYDESRKLDNSFKFKTKCNVSNAKSRKYTPCGYVNVTDVNVLDKDSSFYTQNEYIYDITTETHTFSCNNILVHNCVAITMYPFLLDGLKGLGGVSVAPTDLKSFCGEFINLVYSVSSQFMGAVATPEFLMYMDYFIRKDYGDDYLERLHDIVEVTTKRRTLEKVIENYFQQVVHSMNMPAGNRGYQTVFWNISYFDHEYFKGVFGDFRFPDGTAPIWETLSWLQKKFMKWFNKERTKYPLTFPVETMALLTDGGNDYLDKEYADFTAEMWAEGHSFFCYLSDSPDSLSSCCRLRNSLKDLDIQDEDHNHTTHQYSMGTASVSTGSKSVMTINLPRVIQNATRRYFDDEYGVTFDEGKNVVEMDLEYDKNDLYEYIKSDISELTERVHKYQTAFNETIKDFLKADMLDVYNAGFIDIRKQYLTVGVNGITDAAEFIGITVGNNEEYKEFVNNILETINICNRKDKTRDCMFNTEFVPAENLAAKNYKWDKRDGYWVSPNRNLYSSYFYNPEDEQISVLDKFKLHGRDYVKFLDGGVALHENLQESLTKEQYRLLLKIAAEHGCNYFTFNVRNTICNDCGFISKHTLEACPHCGSTNIDYLTRVIGYLKRISSFAEPRQIEASSRAYNVF